MIATQASSSENSEKIEETSSSQRSAVAEREGKEESKSGGRFTINPALVPSYVPLRVIEKVNKQHSSL